MSEKELIEKYVALAEETIRLQPGYLGLIDAGAGAASSYLGGSTGCVRKSNQTPDFASRRSHSSRCAE